VAKLTASDAAALDNFGIAVALEGERALVGAWGSESPGGFRGAAYVFESDASGTWQETAKLVSGTPAAGSFGQSVALSGTRALVGDRSVGAAYVFERDALGAWELTATLRGSSNAFFGYDVALSGDRALVGGYWGPHARLFERQPGGAWLERVELLHEPQGTDWFGFSVALSSSWIAVGAPRDSDLGTNTGSTTVFQLSPAALANPSAPVPAPPRWVPLLLQGWVPFDPLERTVGPTSGAVPVFLLP
jgi:hypothetical protein